jgi:hypothetical protein
MIWQDIIQKIYNKLISCIPWICICFALDGTVILIETAITNGYLPPYTIVSYCLWCFQRYSILFIPLLLYIGYKYKDKVSSNKLNILSVLVFVLIITTLEIIAFIFFYNKYNPSSTINDYLSINYQILQWGSLMIVTFIIFLKSKFSIIFSFSLCYLMFYVADILFELPKTTLSFIIGAILNNSPVFYWLPNITALVLLISCLIIVLYKLKIRFDYKILLPSLTVVLASKLLTSYLFIILYKLKIKFDYIILFFSFIPLLFSWIYFYPIWGIVETTTYISKVKTIEPFDRLFAFPFIITLSLYIWKSQNKQAKRR